ncbi:MAG TPA: thioredoxin domain-containing protein [Candidatus Paceibacterota bacterium]|nr:thioredoxin domain-containing protein [Candidatus Paceibacterota bacterium]
MNTKHLFEKFATPISIIIAGALIGGGIVLAKGITGSPSKTTSGEIAPTSEADVIKSITTLPIVKKLGIKSKDLSACIGEEAAAAVVDGDTALGQAAGLRGTPHMIVLMKKNGKDIQFPLFGALDKSMIEQAISEGKTPTEQLSYIQGTSEKQIITENDHIIGDAATAPATIIEYSDIDCPYCKKLHPTLQQLAGEGKIAWIYRHSPIPQLHPYARVKAIATECVSQLAGKEAFWKYLDELVKE